jgi:hypothetical protein
MGTAGVRLRLPLKTSKLENRKIENRKPETQEGTASKAGFYKSENLPGDAGDNTRADQQGGG